MSCKIVRLSTPQFEEMPEYSCSLPTGTTIGKRWKRNLNFGTREKAVWWMGEYVEDPEPGRVGIEWKEIEIYDSLFANC